MKGAREPLESNRDYGGENELRIEFGVESLSQLYVNFRRT